MKTLLLLLITSFAFSQNAVLSFYAGSDASFGSSVLFKRSDTFYLGFGFSGNAEKDKALGSFKTSSINEWDKSKFVSNTNQKWFAVYSKSSFGYFKGIMISYDLGLEVQTKSANFQEENGSYYHKDDSIVLKPLIGINASYDITEDYGVTIGYDTFSEFKLGLTVYF
jgi:hypothetical protein